MGYSYQSIFDEWLKLKLHHGKKNAEYITENLGKETIEITKNYV